jgi:hypothetical protein
VMLSYWVGAYHSVLFVIQPVGKEPGLKVFTLPVTAKALRERVEEFRGLIRQRSSASQATLLVKALELYDLLLKPAESLLSAANGY